MSILIIVACVVVGNGIAKAVFNIDVIGDTLDFISNNF